MDDADGAKLPDNIAVPLGTGVPDAEVVSLNEELPDAHDEVELTAVPDADGVWDIGGDALGVGVGDRRTATLRAVMVALRTPASLASQE